MHNFYHNILGGRVTVLHPNLLKLPDSMKLATWHIWKGHVQVTWLFSASLRVSASLHEESWLPLLSTALCWASRRGSAKQGKFCSSHLIINNSHAVYDTDVTQFSFKIQSGCPCSLRWRYPDQIFSYSSDKWLSYVLKEYSLSELRMHFLMVSPGTIWKPWANWSLKATILWNSINSRLINQSSRALHPVRRIWTLVLSFFVTLAVARTVKKHTKVKISETRGIKTMWKSLECGCTDLKASGIHRNFYTIHCI